MLEATVKKILQARVYEAACETPISPAPFLSRRFNNQILIKREDLQPVFSFKIRGAYNKMAQLTDEQKAKGVIAASAGNHAQGLAMAAKLMGVKAVIVMPRITPDIKVQAVRARGAKVVLKGDAFAAAAGRGLEHHRVADLLGQLDAFVHGTGGAVGRLLEAQLVDHVLETLTVFRLVDGVRAGADDRHAPTDHVDDGLYA